MTENNGLPTYTHTSDITRPSIWDITRLRKAILADSKALRHLETAPCHSIRYSLKGAEYLVAAPRGTFTEDIAVYIYKMPDTILEEGETHDCGVSTLIALYYANFPWEDELEEFAASLEAKAKREARILDDIMERMQNGDRGAFRDFLMYQMTGDLPDDNEPRRESRGGFGGFGNGMGFEVVGLDGFPGLDDADGEFSRDFDDDDEAAGDGDDDDEAFFAEDDGSSPETGEEITPDGDEGEN